jgi:hypothetical protein
MRSFLAVRQGQYCVALKMAVSDRPVWRTLYYPTGIDARYGVLDHLLGEEARKWNDTYRVGGKVLALVNGGKTWPIDSEEEPIPAPSRAKGWEWRDCEWVRGSRRVSYLYG